MKDLGILKYYLGIEVLRNKDGIYLSQKNYALDLIYEYGDLCDKPIDTPIEQHHSLARDDSEFLSDPQPYQRLVGRLVYLAVTKPEVSYAVHTLTQFLQTPRTNHWLAALRVI